ncbi:MAG: hypothetical protein IJH83_04680 [Coriobacteriales bacterium]|nr:hypothetical protein [Coriobacteriales bacterium]
MNDLNGQLFYRTRFDIADQREGNDLLWVVVLKIREWMCDKWAALGIEIEKDFRVWTRFKLGSSFTSTDDARTVSFESSAYPSGHLLAEGEDPAPIETWACVITEVMEAPERAPRIWTSEIGYEQHAIDRGTLTVIISYQDRPGFMGLVQDEPAASVPRLVRRTLGDRNLVCSVGGRRVSMYPKLLALDDVADFCAFLGDPDRELPVLFLSPTQRQAATDEAGDEPSAPESAAEPAPELAAEPAPEPDPAQEPEPLIAPLLDPQMLANILCPNVEIVYTLDPQVVHAMSEALPRDRLRCTNGAVRLYVGHPDFSNPAESARHRFLSARKIEEYGEAEAVGILRRVLAQDQYYYQSFLRLDDVKLQLRRARYTQQVQRSARERIEQAQQHARERVEQVQQDALERLDEHRRELEEDTLAELISLEDERDHFVNLCDELERKLYASDARAAALQAQFDASMTTRSAAIEPGDDLDAAQVVNVFLAAYPDRIDLTEAAWQSLDDCTTDLAIVWQMLYDLATVIWPLYDEGIPNITKECRQRGCRYEFAATEGCMTKNDSNLAANYLDVYKGREINCMAHLINGTKASDPKFCRIYFVFVREEGRIIISSIGPHKRNYTTTRMH